MDGAWRYAWRLTQVSPDVHLHVGGLHLGATDVVSTAYPRGSHRGGSEVVQGSAEEREESNMVLDRWEDRVHEHGMQCTPGDARDQRGNTKEVPGRAAFSFENKARLEAPTPMWMHN